MSDTLEIREKLIQIAFKDAGKKEDTHNQADWIKKYWPATSYPEGYENIEPYCAAAQCWFVREWLKLPEVKQAFAMTSDELEEFRPKSASVFEWEDWADAMGLDVLDINTVLHTGDMMIFDCSHIGVVWTDRGDNILTIEANTGPMGERDGDGCYIKIRSRYEARSFIRILD